MKKRDVNVRTKWHTYWVNARLNVLSALGTRKHTEGWTLLAKLLGYETLDSQGRNSATKRMRKNFERGSTPACKKKQKLLIMLAGPHGQTIAKAIAARRGLR